MTLTFFTVNFVLLVVFGINSAWKNGDICITHNSKYGTCLPPTACDTATTNKSSATTELIQQLQCGKDEALICCLTFDDGTSLSIWEIFTKIPTDVTTKTEPPVDSHEKTLGLANEKYDVLPDNSVCGIEKETPRIFGGEITGIDEFPWLAALEYKSGVDGTNLGIRCGGSLINTRFILTAAHCILSAQVEIISAWLGEWQISTNPDCITALAHTECADEVIKAKIKELIPHEYYSQRSNQNDVALILLENEVEYTDYIHPICLPPENLPNPEFYTRLTVAGWGITETGTYSDFKLKVELPLLSNNYCKEIYNRALPSSQLCAGGEAGKDGCQGDSGGPLMRTYEDPATGQSQWYQEGVMSWGLGCGRNGYGASYTRVSRYTRWIVETIAEKMAEE